MSRAALEMVRDGSQHRIRLFAHRRAGTLGCNCRQVYIQTGGLRGAVTLSQENKPSGTGATTAVTRAAEGSKLASPRRGQGDGVGGGGVGHHSTKHSGILFQN